MSKLTSSTLLTIVATAICALLSLSTAFAQNASSAAAAPSSEANKSNAEKTAQPKMAKKTSKSAATNDAKTSDAAAPKVATRADRLDLETTMVTGNRELPKVLYIVPWKRAELGELPAQPFNTLLDEMLQPVDREVFKREVKYFQAVNSGNAATNATTRAAPSVSGAAPPTTTNP